MVIENKSCRCGASRERMVVTFNQHNASIQCEGCLMSVEGPYDNDGNILTLRGVWNTRYGRDERSSEKSKDTGIFATLKGIFFRLATNSPRENI